MCQIKVGIELWFRVQVLQRHPRARTVEVEPHAPQRRSVHVISSSQLRHPLSRLRMSVSTSFLSVGPQRHEQSTCHQIGHQHPGLGKSWAPFPAVIKSWIYGMRAVEATKRELVQRVPRSLPLKIAESPATITARSWQVIIVPRTMHFVVTLPSLFTTILWSFHS